MDQVAKCSHIFQIQWFMKSLHQDFWEKYQCISESWTSEFFSNVFEKLAWQCLILFLIQQRPRRSPTEQDAKMLKIKFKSMNKKKQQRCRDSSRRLTAEEVLDISGFEQLHNAWKTILPVCVLEIVCEEKRQIRKLNLKRLSEKKCHKGKDGLKSVEFI